jgi:hypothetical protein
MHAGMSDLSDTGDLWLRTPQVQAIYGVSERTAQWWPERYDCAVMVPRDGGKGGEEHRYYRPVLDRCRRVGDTGSPATEAERETMRAHGLRFLEP